MKDQDLWRRADQLELDGLFHNQVLAPVTRAEVGDCKVIPTRFIRTKKSPDEDGRRRLKSRLIALGHILREKGAPRVYTAPVAQAAVPKVIVSIALTLNTPLYAIDISQAFLKSKMPEGHDRFVSIMLPGGDRQTFHLRKSLYGLPESPAFWFSTFSSTLQAFGMESCPGDSCLFATPDRKTMISIHVDDGLVLSFGNQLEPLLAHLRKAFGQDSVEVKEFRDGVPTRHLGIVWTMHYAEKYCTLDQSEFLVNVLEDFDMHASSPVPTPATQEHLPAHTVSGESHPLYSKWVGCLQWLLITRVDIAHAVKSLARHVRSNSRVHERAVKRCFRYLNGTRDLKLVVRGASSLSQLQLVAYSDASYAQCEDTRRSTTGLILSLVGSVITAKSSLQKSVAISACESELYGIFECALYVLQMRQLLEFMGLKQTAPTTLYTDSQSAMALLDKPALTGRSKHLDVRWHKLREIQRNQDVALQYMNTNVLPPDFLTKDLDRVTFERHRDLIMSGRLPVAT